MHLVRREPRVELTAALHGAARRGEPVTYRDVAVEEDGVKRRLNIVARPLPPTNQGRDELFLVVFEELPAAPVAHDTPLDAPTLEHHRQLQRDLESTQARLQATIGALEDANEALRSSNEQLQAMSDETRSANEELQLSPRSTRGRPPRRDACRAHGTLQGERRPVDLRELAPLGAAPARIAIAPAAAPRPSRVLVITKPATLARIQEVIGRAARGAPRRAARPAPSPSPAVS